jgi:hypothetical protein
MRPVRLIVEPIEILFDVDERHPEAERPTDRVDTFFERSGMFQDQLGIFVRHTEGLTITPLLEPTAKTREANGWPANIF